MRATRRANHLAVIQILIVTAAFVGAMVIVIAAAYLVVEVIAALI